jgi:histidinol-phosphatase
VAEPTVEDLLDFAQDAAWNAGKITLRYWGTGVVPEFKHDQSPVTVADREAEEYLRARITGRFPDHGILGEEWGSVNEGARYRWILDPIDGTKSFVQGVPLYGVLVGLERDGEPVLGVCNIPATGELVAAARGHGCTLNGRRVRVSNVERLEDAVFVQSSPSFADYGRGAVYDELMRRCRLTRTWGDCYGYVMVATGRAELMLDPVMNIWDCAALLPIMEEAGGTFTDWRGTPTIDGGDAFATNGRLFDAVMNVIKRHDAAGG